jgi:putative FmdB family regulatory protein
MPTYEYQCKSCEHRFEVWQKMTDEPLTICPECNGPIRRILFPAGIVFKGSGFYKTDHGNGAVISENNHNNQSEGKEQKDGAAKKEAASETKATSKSEKSTPAGGDKAVAAAD